MPGKVRKCLRDKTLHNVLVSELSETDKHCIVEVFVNYEHMLDKDQTEMKHGNWIFHNDGSGTCSVCGRHQKHIWDMCSWQKYCGHCGAKMDGERRTENDR